MAPPVRLRQSAVDACPGALRLHAAADGPLARVRLPGGMLTGAQLAVLSELAKKHGDGWLELTSRANVQLRALTKVSPAALAARLWEAGMLPSEAHETVRNIAAPPLAGAQIRGLVRELDEALCADLGLAALPGRFLFAIGQVPLDADVAAIPLDPAPVDTDVAAIPRDEVSPARDAEGPPIHLGQTPNIPKSPLFAVFLGNVDVGLRVGPDEVVPALLAAAHGFLSERAEDHSLERPAWRVRELSDGAARVASRVTEALGIGSRPSATAPLPRPPADASLAHPPATAPLPRPPADASLAHPPASSSAGAATQRDRSSEGTPIGIVAQGDGLFAVGALVPLGRLGGVQGKVLAKAERLVVTTGRGIVVRDVSAEAAEIWKRDLAAAGFEVERGSRWVGVTSCAGKPGCAKALADVRADADATTEHVDGLPVHWVGCARGCGSPSGPHVRVEATPGGYSVSRLGMQDSDVDTAVASTVELGKIVAGARRR